MRRLNGWGKGVFEIQQMKICTAVPGATGCLPNTHTGGRTGGGVGFETETVMQPHLSDGLGHNLRERKRRTED
jgi:hypothetical protein